MRESKQHAQAFEIYYKLDEKRSHKEVAKKCKVHPRTVHTWSIKYNWVERVKLRDIENQPDVEKATNKQVINEKAKQLERIQKIIDGSPTEQNFIIKALNNSMKRDEEGNLILGKDKKPILDIKAGDPRGLAELARSLVSLRKAETDAMKHQLLLLGEADSRTEQGIVFISRIPRPAENKDDDDS